MHCAQTKVNILNVINDDTAFDILSAPALCESACFVRRGCWDGGGTLGLTVAAAGVDAGDAV